MRSARATGGARGEPAPGPGLVGRGPLFVPALVFAAWTAAGAAEGGTGDGEVTPFLLAIASDRGGRPRAGSGPYGPRRAAALRTMTAP